MFFAEANDVPKTSRACAKSAIKLSASSMPTESLKSHGVMLIERLSASNVFQYNFNEINSTDEIMIGAQQKSVQEILKKF